MRSAHLEMLRFTLRTRVLDWASPPKAYVNPPPADHTALRVTGGIGDLILALGPAEALHRETGDVRVYSKWPEIAKLFTALPCLHEDVLGIRGYDLVINLNSLCIFQFHRDWKSFHSPALERIYVRNQEFLRRDGWAEIAAYHPYLDNIMGKVAVDEGLTRYDVTFATLGLPSTPFRRSLGLPRPARFPYITIHDGFDINNKKFLGAERATKTWDLAKWSEFITLFRNALPGISVVQIGGPTSRRVPGVDIDNVAALPFRDSLAWLEHSLCHFDGDSGLMHSAHALGVPTVALYGPTPASFFGYPDNANVSASLCGNCWWLTPDWVARCPLGFQPSACMESISALDVFHAFRGRFGARVRDALLSPKENQK